MREMKEMDKKQKGEMSLQEKMRAIVTVEILCTMVERKERVCEIRKMAVLCWSFHPWRTRDTRCPFILFRALAAFSDRASLQNGIKNVCN